MTTDSNPDKSALSDNIQRTVERSALRKVRKLVDELDAEETAKHRLGRRALIIAVVVGTVAMVWLVSGLIAGDEKYERGQTIQMPEKVVVPKKE